VYSQLVTCRHLSMGFAALQTLITIGYVRSTLSKPRLLGPVCLSVISHLKLPFCKLIPEA